MHGRDALWDVPAFVPYAGADGVCIILTNYQNCREQRTLLERENSSLKAEIDGQEKRVADLELQISRVYRQIDFSKPGPWVSFVP